MAPKVSYLTSLFLLFVLVDVAESGRCSTVKSYTAYTIGRGSTNCGFLWLSRCTTYHRRAVTRYRAEYRCCDGYEGSPYCSSPICNPGCQGSGVCVKPDVCDCPSHLVGSICQLEVCSARRDCYPGVCNPSNLECTCNSGFGGDNCQTMTSNPRFNQCKASTKQSKGPVTETNVEVTCPDLNKQASPVYISSKNLTHIGLFSRISYEKIHISVNKPSFVQSYNVGITNARATIQIQNQDNSIAFSRTKDCSDSGSSSSPKDDIVCSWDLQVTTTLKHGQRVNVELQATTGGSKRVNRDGSIVTLPYTGKTGSTKSIFKFDLQRPTHCKETQTCTFQLPEMISFGSDVTKIPGLNISFNEWSDADSGIESIIISIYRMSLNDDGLLQEHKIPLQTHSLGLMEGSDKYFTSLPERGRYAIIGEVTDYVGNKARVRSTILYGGESKVETTDKKFTVSGATETNGMFWQTKSTSLITISWDGRYHNKFLQESNLLAPLAPFDGDMDDVDEGILGNDEVTSAGGVSNFFYRLEPGISGPNDRRKRAATDSEWVKIEESSESIEIPDSLISSGDGLTFMLKAEDILSNSVEDQIYIRMDSSPPQVHNDLYFVPKVETKTDDLFSSINIPITDEQSGIHEITFTIHDGNQILVTQGKEQGQKSTETSCASSPKCYCTNQISLEECYPLTQRVMIDTCEIVKYSNKELHFNATITNMALLKTEVIFKVASSELQELREIQLYLPLQTLEIDQSTGILKVMWTLPLTCHAIDKIKLIVSTGNREKETAASAKEGFAMLPEVDIRQKYEITATILYSSGQESEHKKVSSEYAGKTGNSLGLYVGVPVGLVVLIIVLSVIVVMVVRRKRRNPSKKTLGHQPMEMHNNLAYEAAADDNVYTPDLKTNNTHSNCQKFSADQVKLGKVIKTGRFAEIKRGTLKMKNGNQEVAVKMAKNHVNDSGLESRITFMASLKIHKNLMNFVGSCVDGQGRPMLLLELCDESLGDWLTNLKSGDFDVEELKNISLQAAQGLEHLHENRIIHRRLGARNILLQNTKNGQGIVAKVAGIVPSTLLNETNIPGKWLAMEQLGLATEDTRPYNQDTDVWSFGVLLWEIFSKGSSPYSRIEKSDLGALKMALNNGQRLERPTICPEDWYTTVLAPCWEASPSARPAASYLAATMDQLMTGPAGAEYSDDIRAIQLRNSVSKDYEVCRPIGP